jgi:CheY-like chemotaxis protein
MTARTTTEGLRILLIEDEPIVAVLAEDLLDAIGCTVVTTAGSVADAEAAIALHSFDIAMVDINLGGEDGLIAADALKARQIPYLVTTGYDTRDSTHAHAAAPVLTKPYSLADLEAALLRCVTDA